MLDWTYNPWNEAYTSGEVLNGCDVFTEENLDGSIVWPTTVVYNNKWVTLSPFNSKEEAMVAAENLFKEWSEAI